MNRNCNENQEERFHQGTVEKKQYVTANNQSTFKPKRFAMHSKFIHHQTTFKKT